MNTLNELLKIIDQKNNEIIRTASELISYASVKSLSEKKNEPFGPECARVLEAALEICNNFGFETKNVDGYIGYAQIGQGCEMIGLLVHLDVVPVSDNWSTNPFDPIVKNGKLYGRGALDDKSAAAICIHILKVIKDSNIPLNKRIRIIFGLDEESDWQDIERYLKTEELPTIGFTPDADFPVIFAEKGILQLELSYEMMENDLKMEINGGEASNSVAAYAHAIIQGRRIESRGVPAHGSTPEKGVNAISLLINNIYELELKEKNNKFINFYRNYINNETNGLSLECNCYDESGALSLNVGKIKTENKKISITMDIRYPISCDSQNIINNIENKAGEYNVAISVISNKKPIYFDKNSYLIKSLLDAYNIEMKENAIPIAIGGGTYARAMPNIVAFGPLFLDSKDSAHQDDEFISLDDLNKAARIYTRAIINLLEK